MQSHCQASSLPLKDFNTFPSSKNKNEFPLFDSNGVFFFKKID